jgi:peptidoglycan/LPS O-acetylase OafA/YrhL
MRDARRRLGGLDALRGLAALTVVVHHFLIANPAFIDAAHRADYAWFKLSPLHVVWAGREAVILFFILSGFVLSIPWWDGRRPATAAFFVRRLFRIYPAYLVAVLAATAGDLLISRHGLAGMSTWFNSVWARPPDAPTLVSHLLLVPPFDPQPLDPVLWSLSHEMRISLLFPLLMWFVMRYDWRFIVGVLLPLSWLGGLFAPMSWISSIEFLLMFAVGALLARERARLTAIVRNLGNLRLGAALLLAVFLYTVNFWLPLQPRPVYSIAVDDWSVCLASLLLIAVALGAYERLPRPVEILGTALGKVSYSLYLIHAVVLFSIVYLLVGVLPVAFRELLALPVVFAAATAMYLAVELPGIALGARLARLLPARSGRPDVGGFYNQPVTVGLGPVVVEAGAGDQ